MDEDRKISFYSDAARNYMVLECPPGLKDNYQYKMLAANRIRGLLDCSSRTIDSREYIYYDITSKQSLTDLYDRRPVRSADLHRILEDLVHVEETLTEYLLDTAHLIPEPSCIYMDFREQACSFVYYPGEEQQKGLEVLFTFLADRVDGRDKQAAALIYRLCMMAEKPGFRLRPRLLSDLGMHLDKESGTHETGAPSYEGEFEKTIDPFGGRDRGYESPFSEPGVRPAGEGRNRAAERGKREDRADRWARADRYRKEDDYDYGSYDFTEMKDASLYKNREEDEEDLSREKDKAEGQETAGRGPWGWIIAGVLLAAGIAFLLSGRFWKLGERELLLSRAFGGLAAGVGAVMLIARGIRGRRKKRAQKRREEEVAPIYIEPQPWERQAFSSAESSRGNSFYGNRDMSSYTVADSPRRPPAAPGETGLLGPETGRASGLYGTGYCRGERISLERLPCVVGKMRDYVDQVIDDSSVSRMHARFSLDRDGKMTVRDLNSTNGTWLNGERLQPNESRPVQQGDHLRFGRMEYVFR